MAIKREIRDQSFQFRVFFAQLPELPQFAEAQPRVFPFPCVERLLGNSNLPADLYDGRAALCLPQRGQHLLFGMPTSMCHRRVLLLSQEDHAARPFLKLPLAYFSGFGSPSPQTSLLVRMHVAADTPDPAVAADLTVAEHETTAIAHVSISANIPGAYSTGSVWEWEGLTL